MAVLVNLELETIEYWAAEAYIRSCIEWHNAVEGSRAITLCKRGPGRGIWFLDFRLHTEERSLHAWAHRQALQEKEINCYRIYVTVDRETAKLVKRSVVNENPCTDVELEWDMEAVIIEKSGLELTVKAELRKTFIEFDTYKTPRDVLVAQLGKANMRKNRHDMRERSISYM